MEQRMMWGHSHSGIALVTVLFITGIGLLFGAGALLLFRNQCQLRIERQHEMEKIYAVRSALNFTRIYSGEMLDEGMSFSYCTGSERTLSLLVKPTPVIFPVATNIFHLYMENYDLGRYYRAKRLAQYSSSPDYEYGSVGETNIDAVISAQYNGNYGLSFSSQNATNGVKWWVNVGMHDEDEKNGGGWLHEEYGRRYYFRPLAMGGTAASKDAIRLCLIRNVRNNTKGVGDGCRCGWPLSQEGECALVLQLIPQEGKGNDVLTFSEYRYIGGCVINSPPLIVATGTFLQEYLGFQMAGNNVTVFQLNKVDQASSKKSQGYTFLGTDEISAEAFRYFAEEQEIGGVRYPGTNVVNGVLTSPELRAVFEVEVRADHRTSPSDFLSEFCVTRAYQYDVYAKHAASNMELATVAQKVGFNSRSSKGSTFLTYDTHGTENRGFRKDEREAERRRNGQ